MNYAFTMKKSDNHQFGSFLIQVYNINTDIILEALEIQQKKTIPIGRLAIDLGYMSVRQIMDTLFAQGDSKKRFGQFAIELGFITKENLQTLLKSQKSERPELGDILVDMKVMDRTRCNKCLEEFTQWKEC